MFCPHSQTRKCFHQHAISRVHLLIPTPGKMVSSINVNYVNYIIVFIRLFVTRWCPGFPAGFAFVKSRPSFARNVIGTKV